MILQKSLKTILLITSLATLANLWTFAADPENITLGEIKANPKLKDMLLIRKGMRLSIQPVTKEEFDEVISMGGA